MKGWQLALLCLAIAALSVLGTLLFIGHIDDVPRYTADQVIAVAKAYAGEDCVRSSSGKDWWAGEQEPDKASWATVYLGDGKWRVTKECTSVTAWTFYEATGELRSS